MSALEQLQGTVISCTHCPRLVAHREAVAEKKRARYLSWEYWGKPLPSFGDPKARLLIVGLAPAAHGGNRTGRMFTGDRSGDWLYGTLYKFGFASSPHSSHRQDGLTLYDAYITAALHCAPPANKPLPAELLNCRPYLIRELELLNQIRVVVALGKIAFDSYLGTYPARGLQLPSPRPRFGHGVTYTLEGTSLRPLLLRGDTGGYGIVLIGSYHPSQQNTQTGRLTREMFEGIFQSARQVLD